MWGGCAGEGVVLLCDEEFVVEGRWSRSLGWTWVVDDVRLEKRLLNWLSFLA